MYSGTRSAVKLSTGVTDTFAHTVGLKQGCPLSPLLFNVYVNDLEQFLNNEGHHGITIGNKHISSILFADDVLILANNANDLQYLIDRLVTFSLQWGLVINTEETEVMIFNKAGRLLEEHFTCGTTQLKTVDKFIYLGIVFVPSGIFVPTQTRLTQRANTALYMIKKGLLRNRDVSIKPATALKLFDAYVKPILIYNCEIWAPSGLRNRSTVDPHTFNLINLNTTEAVHTHFCKYILGLSEQS